MNDLISKQDAIDAIYHAFCYAYCNNCDKEMNEDLCGECHRKYQNWSASKKVIEKVINSLPSAQPKTAGRCINCKYRYDGDCPMRFEEIVEIDDDGYIDHDVIYHDFTRDDGYCDRWERRTDE